MRYSLFLTALLAVMPLAAHAQATQGTGSITIAQIKQRFEKADTNGDGALDRNEAKAMPRVAQHFDDIDADHDGKVSMQEIGRYLAAMRGNK
ncbi:hypothetical protein [Dyella sp.]|uniref:hypothetical protein n=1 Tax=Dyella sp. TaxID=1869338 RepID=UPI002ED59D76